MKKLLCAAFVVLLATSAHADCGSIEYAQLKEMGHGALKSKLNYYETSYKTYMDEALSQARRGRAVAATHFNKIAIKCRAESEKVRQVMDSRGIGEETENNSSSQGVNSNIYRSVDKDGTMVFSDNPR